MGRKGLAVLGSLIEGGYSDIIDKVIIARDDNMSYDYYDELLNVCREAQINVSDRNEDYTIDSPYCITIAWRWIIPLQINTKLIVIHDSLLPKYRGFAPLVNMLINKEPFLGVTALFASEEYDKGDIIGQKTVAVNYPIKVFDAIDLITPLYSTLVCEILGKIQSRKSLSSFPQNEEDASYSLWRDEDDYRIDWSQSSDDILQFIYSVGFPFKGASSRIDNCIVRIIDAEVFPDVRIENRQYGKVLFTQNRCPVVVCGKGLLKITVAINEKGESVLPLRKFRTRFA